MKCAGMEPLWEWRLSVWWAGLSLRAIGVREVSREAHEVAGMQRQTRFEIEREADVYGVGGLRFRQVQVWRIPNKLSALVRSADHAVDDVYYVSALRFRESARAMKRDLLRSYQGGQYMGVAQITLLVTTLMAIVLGTVSTVTERINGTLPLLLSFSLGGRTVACAKTLAVGIACGSCSLATIVATGAWASLWLGGLGVEGSAVLSFGRCRSGVSEPDVCRNWRRSRMVLQGDDERHCRFHSCVGIQHCCLAAFCISGRGWCPPEHGLVRRQLEGGTVHHRRRGRSI